MDVAGASTGRFDVDRMWKLVALTRHGGLDVVGSFDSFHALRLVCVILVTVMTSSHLLFFSPIILSIDLFPDYMVPHRKGCLNSCSCMFHIDIPPPPGPYAYARYSSQLFHQCLQELGNIHSEYITKYICGLEWSCNQLNRVRN